MSSKALDQNQIKTLLRQQQKKQTPIVNWPNKGDRKLIHEAAVAKKETVTLGDGREFRLRHEVRKSIAWGDHEVVFVGPINGYVPCGWFRVKSLLAGGDN